MEVTKRRTLLSIEFKPSICRVALIVHQEVRSHYFADTSSFEFGQGRHYCLQGEAIKWKMKISAMKGQKPDEGGDFMKPITQRKIVFNSHNKHKSSRGLFQLTNEIAHTRLIHPEPEQRWKREREKKKTSLHAERNIKIKDSAASKWDLSSHVEETHDDERRGVKKKVSSRSEKMKIW